MLKKQKKISNSQLSVNAGKERNYLAILKTTNKKKYRLLKLIGINEYEDNCNKLRNQLSDMYYEILEEDDMQFVDFQRLYLDDEFRNVFIFHSFINHHAFSGSTFSMPTDSYKKLKAVLKKYDIYKKTKLKEAS